MTRVYIPEKYSERKLAEFQSLRYQLDFVRESEDLNLWIVYVLERGLRVQLSSMVFVGIENACQYFEHRGWRIVGRSEFMRKAREVFWFVFGEKASDMRNWKHELRKIKSRYPSYEASQERRSKMWPFGRSKD